MCKSRGARCFEQGSEDPRFSGSKQSNLRKQSTNARKSKKQTGTSIDQPEKVFEDAETSDLVLSEKIGSAPIVSLLLDAKVNWIIGKIRVYLQSAPNLIHSFLS